ncbi:MAG: hypothetical protein LBQ95_09030 [Lachnospiraceae bacterium]|jgi:hypothetical protein|nr:hypothetical protein [Lachnospiraceae bacterium]
MIRSAKDPSSKCGLVKPEKPVLLKKMDFKKDVIKIEYSHKTDSELLAELDMPVLSELTSIIIDSLFSENTDILRIFITFMFCHKTNSNTKGKEYKRTDFQKIKNKSKTNSRTFPVLYSATNSKTVPAAPMAATAHWH